MNHEEEFLEQIRAAPDDDEPRLVYADWLEERGDPRGEFIRIQCELAKIDPYTMTDENEFDRRDELMEREGDLRIAHEDQWTGSFAKYVRAVQFRRGMIEYVEADADAIIEHASQIFGEAPIRLMTVTRSRRNLKELVEIEGVQKLRGLALDGSFLQEEDIAQLVRLIHFNHLEGLSLSRCGLTDDEMDAFESLRPCRLKQLDLSANRLRNPSASLIARCPGFQRLEVLNLAANEIRFNGAKALTNSSELQSLRQLIMQGNPLEQRSIDALRSRYDNVVI